jgi:hypothetical protein
VEIRLTRLGGDRHRLEIARGDGTGERVELETRSFLRHDLAHYAVEAEVPLARGFWGSLAAGATLQDLAHEAMSAGASPDLALAERLVGPFQSAWAGRLPWEAWVEGARTLGLRDAQDVAHRAAERMRRLHGHWNATRHGCSMLLTWPP